jgi:hypothetical protein
MIYEIIRYAADGHAGEPGDGVSIHSTDTINKARDYLRRRVGDNGQWIDDKGRECWHESFAEGCGGYIILSTGAEA